MVQNNRSIVRKNLRINPIQKNDFLFLSSNKKLYCEKYLKIIVNSSLDGITVLDEHGKFEFANDSFFRITGWPKEEIIGQFFLKMIP